MVKYFKLVVTERYAKFDGRAGRAEYWWFVLAHSLVMFLVIPLVGVLVGAPFRAGGAFTIWLLVAYYLGTLIPTLAVAVRRLHDTNHSGWSILLNLIPFLGLYVLFLFLVEGDQIPNQYGDPDPGLATI